MIQPFNGIVPKISDKAFAVAESAIIGDVELLDGANVWYWASLRGDIEKIIVGEDSNIQDNVTVHTAEGKPVIIGRGVTIGHNAVVHGCVIGDNTLVGMGAVILDGAVIGKNCIIGAGALVRQGMEVPDGTMVLGVPAQIKRALREEEIAANRVNAQEYVRLIPLYRGK